MKILFLSAFLILTISLLAHGQQGSTTQTEHQHSSHSTVQPSEHKNQAEWHYHRGQKRTQAPYDTLPGKHVEAIETGRTDSSRYNKHDK